MLEQGGQFPIGQETLQCVLWQLQMSNFRIILDVNKKTVYSNDYYMEIM